MKRLLPIAVLMLLLAACRPFGYEITVEVPQDFTDTHELAYLTDYDTGDTIEGVSFLNGCYTFKGRVKEPMVGRIFACGHRITLIVENEEIHVDTLGVATGTPMNDAFNDICEDLNRAETDEDAAKRLLAIYRKNATNVIGPWSLVNYATYASPTVEQFDSLLTLAPNGFEGSKRVAKARADILAREITSVGKPFADFEVMGEDGHLQKLSDYVGKGHYALVDFWASWCGPCRKEIATLKKLRDELGTKIDFVGVAVWDAPDDTRRAIDELQIPWPVIVGTEKLSAPTDLYGIGGIPCILLIGPDGTILSRGLQGEELVADVKAKVK